MFVGHFAVGLAAKSVAPRVSLGTLILAAAFSDVLWILFFAVGIEQVVIQPGIMVANSLNLVYIPFSHSLLMDAVWGGLFAAIYFLLRQDSRGAWTLCIAVLSHWVLDWVTHWPDMPLAPGLAFWIGAVELPPCHVHRRRCVMVWGDYSLRSSDAACETHRRVCLLDNDRVADRVMAN